MTSPVTLLAQLEGLNPLKSTVPDTKAGGLVFKDLLLIIGTAMVLACLLAVWTRFYMRRRQRQRHHHQREAKPTPSRTAIDSEPGDEPEERRRRRRRRHRRDHRPRNPTLAETGGLPPGKPEGVPPQNP